MFCLGAALSRQGWARKVPPAVARKCGIAVTITLVVAPVLAFSAGVRNFARDGDQFLGGWHWQALALDAVEASLVVAGSVWLLAWAQRRLTSDAPILVASARGRTPPSSSRSPFSSAWKLRHGHFRYRASPRACSSVRSLSPDLLARVAAG